MLQPKWLVGCIKIGPVRMTTLTMTLQTSHCTRSIADLTGTVFVANKGTLRWMNVYMRVKYVSLSSIKCSYNLFHADDCARACTLAKCKISGSHLA